MCSSCGYCRYMYTNKKPVLPNGRVFRPKHFANCMPFGVVCMLICDCGCFYVSKTKLELWKRAYRHIRCMQTCNPDLPLGRHTTIVHQGKFLRIKFLILDHVHPSSRGGDRIKDLLQLELHWIHTSRATHLLGLNEAVCFRHFLEGFASVGMEK